MNTTPSGTDTGAVRNRAWSVAFAGMGINLALGVLYTWSMFKDSIAAFGWRTERLNDPYALCCLVFAFAMIPAGRCQDRFGPRLTASIGGLLVGAGLVLVSFTTNYFAWLFGFGVLVGAGIGFGYSSATPPALKWVPPSRTGLVAGMVVSGFGLAPVYLSPLSQYLLRTVGLQRAMLIFGIAFVVAVCGLAQLLVNPPPGFVPAGAAKPKVAGAIKPGMLTTQPRVLREPSFYLLWLLYFIGAGAGLMVISSISGMATRSMPTTAFLAVAVLAIGNAAGRVVAGIVSDKIGRRWTLTAVLLIQAALMFAAIPVTGSSSTIPLAVLLLATLIGFNYGANLSLFPAFTKDFWGLPSFGINYGLLFTSWGVGGFVLSRLQQVLVARTGSYASSFVFAGVLLVVGGCLTLFLRSPQARD